MSLVLELQRAAMERDQHVSDVLRKANVVAAKLKLTDFQGWCKSELHGYVGSDIPAYRVVKGALKAFNPYNGWIPVVMEDSASQDALSNRAIAQPIGELEDIAANKKDGRLQVPLPHDILLSVFGESESFQLGMVPTLLVGKSQVVGILDSVRNQILDWSLTLEQSGILGEGLTFSKEEVKKAVATYNIGHFHGVLGSVNSSNVQVGNYNTIHAQLKECGVPQAERNELEEILDELPKAQGGSKQALMHRGMAWVVRNGDKLGALSDSIRGWFS